MNFEVINSELVGNLCVVNLHCEVVKHHHLHGLEVVGFRLRDSVVGFFNIFYLILIIIIIIIITIKIKIIILGGFETFLG